MKNEIPATISEMYGIPRKIPDNSILLLTTAELLAITDILRDMTTSKDTLKKIEALEKPFKKGLNNKKSR